MLTILFLFDYLDGPFDILACSARLLRPQLNFGRRLKVPEGGSNTIRSTSLVLGNTSLCQTLPCQLLAVATYCLFQYTDNMPFPANCLALALHYLADFLFRTCKLVSKRRLTDLHAIYCCWISTMVFVLFLLLLFLWQQARGLIKFLSILGLLLNGCTGLKVSCLCKLTPA